MKRSHWLWGAISILSFMVGLASTASAATALLVGQTASASAYSDQAIKARLEALGFTVTVVNDTASTTSQATGMDLVYISSTVGSGNVTTKFRDVAVPVIVGEAGLYDDMQMTDVNQADPPINYLGSSSFHFRVKIVDANSPLAAGLPAGFVTTTFESSANLSYHWGAPAAAAMKVAELDSTTTPTGYTIFAYDTGAAMVGANAPARRVGFFIGDFGFVNLTDEGKRLFDAAVGWAANIVIPPQPTPTAPPAVPTPNFVIFHEDWNSGSIDSNDWKTGTFSQGLIEVHRVEGDYALVMGGQTGASPTIETNELFNRADMIRCTFRVWHGDEPTTGNWKAGIFAPWFFSNAQGDPGRNYYQADFEQGINWFWWPGSFQIFGDEFYMTWQEPGAGRDVTYLSHNSPNSFHDRFLAAKTRATSFLVRVTLGTTSGGLMEISDGPGFSDTPWYSTYTTVSTHMGTPLDTRDLPGNIPGIGVAAANHASAYVGFGQPQTPSIFIDDVYVEQAVNGQFVPVELSSFGVD